MNRRADDAEADWSGRRQPGRTARSLLRARRVWSTVSVPDPADEDQRHVHRELDQLRRDGRTTVTASVVCSPPSVIQIAGKDILPDHLDLPGSGTASQCPRASNGSLHELERSRTPARQIKVLEIEQAEQIRDDQTLHVDKVRRLMGLKGFVGFGHDSGVRVLRLAAVCQSSRGGGAWRG